MDDRNRQIPPLLCDWASGMELARPQAGETCVLRVDLDPRPECDDLERLLQWSVLSEAERARAGLGSSGLATVGASLSAADHCV